MPLPDSISLKGDRGEVPFPSAASPELVSWKESLGGSSMGASLIFRRLSKASETESEDAIAIRKLDSNIVGRFDATNPFLVTLYRKHHSARAE